MIYFRSLVEKTCRDLRKRPITFSLIKILKSNKKVLISEELINKKKHFLFNCGSFRIFYSTLSKRSDFKKIAAYVLDIFIHREEIKEFFRPSLGRHTYIVVRKSHRRS